MNFWSSATGMLEVELTSAEPEAAMTIINNLGIEISNVIKETDLTYRFLIQRKNYHMLDQLCREQGNSLHVIRKLGLLWKGRALTERPAFLIGICFCIILTLYLPSRVLFIKVEGNTYVPTQKIVSAAENSGICIGASRREVRSEKVKNALLSAVPELQWAGVNTQGCVAVISVRERSQSISQEPQQNVTNIVAERDGYILSATATSGNLLVKPGQTVISGQVLISGYTDCGSFIQVTQSEGEILAQTNRELKVVMPSEYMIRTDRQELKRKISLLFRKKRINLWKDSGISDTRCGRMYEEYYITLPGKFVLPIALCIESYSVHGWEAGFLNQTEAEVSLCGYAQGYLESQMIAGKIQQSENTISSEGDAFLLRGNYVCTEMIGKIRQEQIGDTNGKNG